MDQTNRVSGDCNVPIANPAIDSRNRGFHVRTDVSFNNRSRACFESGTTDWRGSDGSSGGGVRFAWGFVSRTATDNDSICRICRPTKFGLPRNRSIREMRFSALRRSNSAVGGRLRDLGISTRHPLGRQGSRPAESLALLGGWPRESRSSFFAQIFGRSCNVNWTATFSPASKSNCKSGNVILKCSDRACLENRRATNQRSAATVIVCCRKSSGASGERLGVPSSSLSVGIRNVARSSRCFSAVLARIPSDPGQFVPPGLQFPDPFVERGASGCVFLRQLVLFGFLTDLFESEPSIQRPPPTRDVIPKRTQLSAQLPIVVIGPLNSCARRCRFRIHSDSAALIGLAVARNQPRPQSGARG